MNIKDIASIAGVSVSTVSKVLNRKDRDISIDTRKRVLAVVKEYQYVPYSKIRKTTTGRSHLLGVFLSENYREQTEILKVIETSAADKGYSIIVCILEADEKNVEKQIKIMEGKNVDGFLWIGDDRTHLELLKQICLERVPCMVLGALEEELGIPAVTYREEQTVYEAVRYLVEKQHVDIGCIAFDSSVVEKGYRKALYDHKIEYDRGKVFTEDISSPEGRMKFREWMSPKFTAIVCKDTESVLYLYRIFNERGISIPKDVSVICCEDSKYFEILKPSVTAVKLPYKKLGEEAVRQIVDAIETKEEYQQPPQEISVVIEERKSVSVPANWKQGQRLVVVGSMNMDTTISVPHIPEGGETMVSTGIASTPGGKGANQAIGASKLGGKVSLIGCLGNDGDGNEIYNSLVKHRVSTAGIAFDGQLPTGKAYINVSGDNGESNIVIYPGANRCLDRIHIQKHAKLFEGAKYCLLSLEISKDAARYTASVCKKEQVPVILKPSGVEKIEPQLLDGIAYFVPNITELNLLFPGEETLEEKAEKILQMGVENVIVTLGKDGCYLRNSQLSRYFAAADFDPVDTTGGADAFISALAVYLSEGVPLTLAIGYATYCAGISITRPGVQPAMPDRMGVDMYQDLIYAQFGEKLI